MEFATKKTDSGTESGQGISRDISEMSHLILNLWLNLIHFARNYLPPHCHFMDDRRIRHLKPD